MTTLYVAIEKTLAIVTDDRSSLGRKGGGGCGGGGGWKVDLQLSGSRPMCLAIDPGHRERIYCGTIDRGLWRTADAGRTWEPVGTGIAHKEVTAVAVSSLEEGIQGDVVYAGTEPSALYRSDDGGDSWRELAALRTLPSAPTWSFPPRPWTSHVKWITVDPLVPGRIFTAIEAGALVMSHDGGQTWEDRKPDGPFDTHTLVMHRRAPDRLFSAAGDGFMWPGKGFAQSDDGGQTWFQPGAGLDYQYLWSVAADPADPETLVVSAAPGPREAHDREFAESAIFRRTANEPWARVADGLPSARGLLASVLAANDAEPHTFYAANNKGIFRSADGGTTWSELPILWPAGARLGHAAALVVC